jgi:hypothetical protein
LHELLIVALLYMARLMLVVVAYHLSFCYYNMVAYRKEKEKQKRSILLADRV